MFLLPWTRAIRLKSIGWWWTIARGTEDTRRFARVPIFPSPRHGDSREIGWRRETRAACSIVRSIDVWNAIDRLAIERIAIRHGDRDRDNARLTSLVPITHEAISHGISPDRIGSIDPPWKFRGDETVPVCVASHAAKLRTRLQSTRVGSLCGWRSRNATNIRTVPRVGRLWSDRLRI